MMILTIKSEFIHDNIYDKAYIAKLAIEKQTGKLNRNFLVRKNIKKKPYSFNFQWAVIKGGVYEKKEQHHYQGQITSYFAVNYNGDIIKLRNRKIAQILLKKGIRSWGRKSSLRIQMYNLMARKS
ncbi:hypothetical protein [Sulfurimonas sp. ST-27]|uniref:hypothetical protein n=1 Tax=Sulfurimonas sp. ST-27 TaxID=3400152 RepID=UPI003AB8FE16